MFITFVFRLSRFVFLIHLQMLLQIMNKPELVQHSAKDAKIYVCLELSHSYRYRVVW